MKSRRSTLKGIASSWTAVLASLLGAGVYAIQAWGHVFGQTSVLDEGLYLYKGLLFATGRYWPFQDFGPWTNHMPLSFMIPGWIQVAFGPGIRTGRYFALILVAIMLIGVWILGCRLGGRWWGAGAVWMVALNPFLVKVYSQAISQGLVAAMLVWVLVLTLGAGRSRWQLIAGSTLVGIVVMTRINMLPVWPLLVAYIYWQHGPKMAFLSLLAGSLVLVIGHAILWPGILKLWADWLPEGVTPFLNPWRESSGAVEAWSTPYPFEVRLSNFWSGVRRNLFPFVGLIAVGLCWPKPRASNLDDRRAAAFLLAIFVSLMGIHAWASLGLNYCVYCFQMYLGFFSFVGILLLVLAFGRWFPGSSRSRQTLAILVITLATVVLGQREFGRMGSSILATHASRIRGMRLVPGSAEIGVTLSNKFGIPESTIIAALDSLMMLWLIALVGFLVLCLVAIMARSNQKLNRLPLVPVLGSLAAVWTAGLSLTFGNSFSNYDCGADVIGSYEQVGDQLARSVDTGGKLYWLGGLSPVPLLYLPQAEIFPAQLNAVYSFREGGEAGSLERFGFWNAELADDWLREADYALVEERYHQSWIEQISGKDLFEEIEATSPAVECRPDSRIHIYRSLP